MEEKFKTTHELYNELIDMCDKYYTNKDSKTENELSQERHSITLKLIEFAKRNLPVDVKNIKPLPYEYGAIRFEFEFNNYAYLFKLWLYDKQYVIQIYEHEEDHCGRIIGKCTSWEKLRVHTSFSFPNPKKYVKGNLVLYKGNCYAVKDYYYDDHSVRYELEYHTGSKVWAAESQLKKFESGL